MTTTVPVQYLRTRSTNAFLTPTIDTIGRTKDLLYVQYKHSGPPTSQLATLAKLHHHNTLVSLLFDASSREYRVCHFLTVYYYFIMVKPIPDKVKECLAELTAAQQVTLRGYIGTLRAEIKELEDQFRTVNDPDPHAHYHGHEQCTADHSHEDHHEKKAEDHSHEHHHGHEKCTENHDHDHHHEKKAEDHSHEHHHGHEKCTENHDHDHHHEKKAEDHSHKHHSHKHAEDKEHNHEHKEHNHEHKHEHSHADKEKEDMPAWKKRAMESGNDPMAAPFGGNWNAESSLSATDTKMEE